jgi:hypothetical protein
MSEQPDAGIPDDLTELADLVKRTRLMAVQDEVVEIITANHAKWYRGWIASGFSVEQATQFVIVMITTSLQS